AVVLGGGVTADVCRRILLNQFRESGRYFVDVEELIADKKKISALIIGNLQKETFLKNQEILDLTAKIQTQQDQIEIDKKTLKKLIETAIKAPSFGNSQPWKWFYNCKNLYLFLSPRSSEFLDFNNMASYMALGSAAENLILKAHELNLEVVEEKFPSADKKLVSVFRFFKKSYKSNASSHHYDYLVNNIENRVTNRNISQRKLIPKNIIAEFQALSQTFQGVDLLILDSEKEIQALAEMVGKSERIRMMHDEMHSDFMNQIRWTEQEVKKNKDGISIASLAPNNSASLGYQMTKHWPVLKLLKDWGGGTAFEELPKKSISSASALGLITASNLSPINFYSVGRALERVWLHSCRQNIALQPFCAINFLFARLTEGNGNGLSDSEINELKNMNDEFTKLFSFNSAQKGIFLFRLFITDKPGKASIRRPVNQVLIQNNKANCA
ncbi:MAG TPA: hypothetical protein VNW99_01760, partial [Cytophagaceae bacterium]|nr:hypothetical protein [Cytophagaceae bacterium]